MDYVFQDRSLRLSLFHPSKDIHMNDFLLRPPHQMRLEIVVEMILYEKERYFYFQHCFVFVVTKPGTKMRDIKTTKDIKKLKYDILKFWNNSNSVNWFTFVRGLLVTGSSLEWLFNEWLDWLFTLLLSCYKLELN